MTVLVAAVLMVLGASYVAPADVDASFGVSGRVLTNFSAPQSAIALVRQPDGKLVAAGFATIGSTSSFALVRYDADGSVDASFGSGGLATASFGAEACIVRALVLQPDGKLVAAGHVGFGIDDFALARFDPDGTLDPSFGSSGTVRTDFAGASDDAGALVLQPDGKLVAAGRTASGGYADFALVRYNPDGTLDPSFGSGGRVVTDLGGSDDEADALVLQPDGKIVAAGRAFNGTTDDFVLARYDADGTLDPSFGSGGIARTDFAAQKDGVAALVLQPDGKLVAAGSTLNPTIPPPLGFDYDFALARYNTNGTLDPSFGTGGTVTTDFTGSEDEATALVLQPDAKLVAAGFAVTTSGFFDFALVRYNADGTLDTSFGTGGMATTDFAGGFDVGNALVLQSDGKLVVAGSSPAGTSNDFALVRYDADGARDVCALAPEPGCRQSGHAQLVIRKRTPTNNDRLIWQWREGAATTVADFGTPDTTTGYQLCLYDPSGPRLGVGIPADDICPAASPRRPGLPCWTAKPKGFKYRNRGLEPDGVFHVLLESGVDGKARIRLIGKGVPLGLPAPPFSSLPLTVQLKRPDGGQCWEATFSKVLTNEPGQFKAKE